MEESFLQTLAAQLRRPEGEFGKKVGENMNLGNAQMNRHALRRLAAGPGDRILELGMGNGGFVRELLGPDKTIRYTGADFSGLMVDEATALNQDLVAAGRARFVLTDGLCLSFDDAAFDKAFTVNTIYFWPDPAAQLAEFRRVLRPGGTLLVAIRPKDTMQLLAFTKYGFTMYSAEELEALLTANGFQVVGSVREEEPLRDFGGQILPSANHIVVAKLH